MPRVRPVTSVALAALVVFFGAAACVPSDSRPTLGTAPVDTLSHEPTGNVDVDRVLARLDGVDGKTFTASYAIRRKLGDLERSASVVQLPPRTLVRIGDVSLFSDPPQQTCDAATGTCEDGLLEQRVAVGRESSPPTVDTAQLAGIGAECLHVPVGGGEETYCVTGDGLLALLDTAAMHIELTSFAPEADPAAFSRPGQASTTTSS